MWKVKKIKESSAIKEITIKARGPGIFAIALLGLGLSLISLSTDVTIDIISVKNKKEVVRQSERLYKRDDHEIWAELRKKALSTDYQGFKETVRSSGFDQISCNIEEYTSARLN